MNAVLSENTTTVNPRDSTGIKSRICKHTALRTPSAQLPKGENPGRSPTYRSNRQPPPRATKLVFKPPKRWAVEASAATAVCAELAELRKRNLEPTRASLIGRRLSLESLGRVASYSGPPSCSQGQLAEESALPGRRLGVCLVPEARDSASALDQGSVSYVPVALPHPASWGTARRPPSFDGVPWSRVPDRCPEERDRAWLPPPFSLPSSFRRNMATTARRWQATRSRSTRRQRPQPSSSSSVAAAAPPSRQSRASRAMLPLWGNEKTMKNSTPISWPISRRRLTLKCSCTSFKTYHEGGGRDLL